MSFNVDLNRQKKLEQVFNQGIERAKQGRDVNIMQIWEKTIEKMFKADQKSYLYFKIWDRLDPLSKIVLAEGKWFSLSIFKSAVKRESN